ncbi:MAG: hypothetical protein B6I26_00760 [Desulfobacteraceae bacterium 4572_130]|nr:MAG: hypothetical protein B6I26_00760 [Desulfobacteraceae bacterium 4572_130]
MAKKFTSSTGEAKLLSKIESARTKERRDVIHCVRENLESFSNKVSMRLIEKELVKTINKNSIQNQILKCLETMCKADDFDIDFQIAPFRNLVSNPNVVSIYLTGFIVETMINHKDVIDIFGSDKDIYFCIQQETAKIIS